MTDMDTPLPPTDEGYPLVGREKEQEALDLRHGSKQPELIAIYGRRRVGKTFLVRRFFGKKICFEMVGNSKATFKEQLGHFATALAAATGMRLAAPRNWEEAFADLIAFLERKAPRGRKVVFFDEFPWLASIRSRFLTAFEQFWNAWASKRNDMVVVITGSAASWMLRNVVGDRGGLHDRVTQQIHLAPFNLHEAKLFLESRGVRWKNPQILELYMALGGIPFYLEQVRTSASPAQNIDHLCFSPRAPLQEEAYRLYASLFGENHEHRKIIRLLAGRQEGMTRDQLLEAAGLASGGGITAILEELEAGGFISCSPSFRHESRDVIYRLIDEFSLFDHTWMRSKAHWARGQDFWLQARSTPRWRNWSGHAFELVCLKHVDQIRKGLGISGVQTWHSVWRHHPRTKDDQGAQIDLVIDRADNVINLCEIKYTDGEFVIDGKYAPMLRRKREVFQNITRTRKTLFTTMIASSGVKANPYRQESVHNIVELDALFAP